MARVDTYLLDRSNPFDLATGAERQANLALTPNPNFNAGAVFGVVQSGTAPIPNAVVKLSTLGGVPVAHTITGSDGLYALRNVPSDSYQLYAVATGLTLASPVSLTVAPQQIVRQDLELIVDPRAALNTIFGLVRDELTDTRLSGATVVLSLPSGQVVDTTTTNADGQFLVCEVTAGSYVITASKQGYAALTPVPVTVTTAQLVRSDLLLTPSGVSQGTVHGFITDLAGAPIAGACVGLYSIVSGRETLARLTFTNAQGLYLIGDVAAGRYLVKAKDETSGTALADIGVMVVG